MYIVSTVSENDASHREVALKILIPETIELKLFPFNAIYKS
jgi:hypothetical protein